MYELGDILHRIVLPILHKFARVTKSSEINLILTIHCYRLLNHELSYLFNSPFSSP